MEWPITPSPHYMRATASNIEPRTQYQHNSQSVAQIFQVVCAAIECLLGVLNHAWLDRHYCFLAASQHYPDGYWWYSARTSLYSTSCSHQCQLNCEAGHSTASSNHCFMITSFRERLGKIAAAHRHHGRAPAASWFKVDASERPLSWLKLCLDCRNVSGGLLMA